MGMSGDFEEWDQSPAERVESKHYLEPHIIIGKKSREAKVKKIAFWIFFSILIPFSCWVILHH